MARATQRTAINTAADTMDKLLGTSQQANESTSPKADQPTSKQKKPQYPTKSYRIHPDVVQRLKLWAVAERRPEQEVAEQALVEFLERVGG